jgi:hypothetical protein
MYSNNAGTLGPMLNDPTQIQMTQQMQQMQQMQQFMQMQMQMLQMMSSQNGMGVPGPNGPNGPMTAPPLGNMSNAGGMLGVPGMAGMGGPETMRHSYMGTESMLDLPFARGDAQMRTMSMVQPSSASWIQPPQIPGFAPSIRIQGYAPSIAPSERSNIGLPGRYRPVSQAPPSLPVAPGHLRKSSTMSGALQTNDSLTKSGERSDEDDEEGWEAMKVKREKKKSLWKMKKSIGGELGAFLR